MHNHGTAMLDRPEAAPTNCADCGGSGIVPDDGSVTDMIGWPLPCACVEAIPPRVRALMRTARPARSTLGSGIYGGAR